MSVKLRERKVGFAPRKSLGQNFLIDKKIIGRIISAARLTERDNVLEVGPGLGILTRALVKRAGRVVAVEKDKRLIVGESVIPTEPRLVPHLAGRGGEVEESKNKSFDKLRMTGLKSFAGVKLQIICRDILKVTAEELRQWFNNQPYKIVANLPYNITSRFLRQFLETVYQPREMILMVQKEVAERMVARPGQMSLLAVSVQFFSDPEILFLVPRRCFSPVPNVDSAVIRLNNIRSDKFSVAPEKFFSVVKKGFSAKRKQLKNNLGLSALAMSAQGLNPTIRPQELSLVDWVRIIN